MTCCNKSYIAENWYSFREAYTHLAPHFPSFTQLVAGYIHKELINQLNETKQKNNDPGNLWALPESPSCSSKSLDEKKYRKDTKHNRRKVKDVLKKKSTKKIKMKHMRGRRFHRRALRACAACQNSRKDSLLSNLKRLELEDNICKAKRTEPAHPILCTVWKPYIRAFSYRTFQLANRSSKYSDLVLNCTLKLAEMVKSQMKAQFPHPRGSNSITGSLATFKLACDSSETYKG